MKTSSPYMNSSVLDVIVIGAGHAGLSISFHLKKLHLNHIVFEKGSIGETWRTQRWDSFKLNTPNKVNLLPGQENIFPDEEGFCSAPEFVSNLKNYVNTFQLPVFENCRVMSVENVPDSKDFSVYVSENGTTKYFRSKQVVIASGTQNIKNLPSFTKNITDEVLQLHTCDYRNSKLLPDGAVLLVGSAQSGIQIAEDLIYEGKKVFISTSHVGRVPRRYRGKDVVEWLSLIGFYDMQTNDVTDPQVLTMKQPQVSNVGMRGHTLSLQALARNGAVILGKTGNADADTIILQPDAAAHVKFADEFSKKVKNMINDYIQKFQLDAPPPEQDTADEPDIDAACASDVTSVNLKENKITSIIWTTGFAGDFRYLKLPVFSNDGTLKHNNGISDIRGLYFLGLPWLRKRKSGTIMGIIEDAEFIAEKLFTYNKITT